ncbi:MAG: hypothetical protein ABSF77_14695 [Spirochaetia bacterium]|jgi:hypothetical protein
MGWSTLYLILGILAGIFGIWNLARQRNVFLSLTGILWFLVVLFEQYIPKVYGYHIASGVPSLGGLFLYVLIPLFIILAFFTSGARR